jgi:hypothetical protein
MKMACTPTFYRDLQQLLKKMKDNYFSCLDDILAEFEGRSISELAQLGDSLNREIH